MTSKSNIIKPDYLSDDTSSSQKDTPKLTQSYIDEINRLPDPVGYRLLIKMWKMSEMTDGGIALSEQTLETSEMTSVVGYVIKMGDMCYKDKDKFISPWCKVGQFVVIGRYAGDLKPNLVNTESLMMMKSSAPLKNPRISSHYFRSKICQKHKLKMLN
jgi:co-chaperonin GroES (HSP10)